jgi:NADPH2:quinone reductase
MRCVAYDRTGPAREVLTFREFPPPEPAPGEVRIRLSTSGVNPSDVKSRAGTRTKVLPFPLIVPHSDGAGVIDAVGEGVASSRLGERVWTWNAAWQRPFGTAAECVVLPSAQAVRLPDGTDFAAGACLGIPALTAWQAVHTDGGIEGRSVLIAGGAGSVGHYAIQFARLAGARQVIATVSSAKKAEVALAAGADATIDYRKEDPADLVLELTGGAGVDRVIEVEFNANVGLDQAVTCFEGDIVVYGSNAPEVGVNFVQGIMKNLRIRFFIVYNLNPADRARALAGVTAALESGKLTHHVGLVLPFDRIVEAHEAVEQGTVTGNVVLDMG